MSKENKSFLSKLKKLPRSFYLRDTIIVSKDLLGKYLVHKTSEGVTAGRIVEVEAYIGPEDKAAHSYNGKKTERNRAMFESGGIAYIFQVYGKNFCFNVVTQREGMPEAVLVRALEPVFGLELMAKRRGFDELSNKNIKLLTNGPSKLCQAMAIDKSLYGKSLLSNNLFIAELKGEDRDFKIISTPRINIDYAGEAKDYRWRLLISGSKFVSRK